MLPDWTIDAAIAPERALALIASAINLPRRRAFGIFKTHNEYVGFAHDGRFEIWERQGRAVHAIGTVRARRGGSRIDVRVVLPGTTRVLIALFFALYWVAAIGIATLAPGSAITLEELAIATGGAAIMAAIFAASARKQSADLRGLVDAIFREVPRI
jgi:hypothetical protein